MKKVIVTEILLYSIFLKKTRIIEKKLGCKFIKINTSNAKKVYDLDYKDGNIEPIIDEFKKKRSKRTRKKLIE